MEGKVPFVGLSVVLLFAIGCLGLFAGPVVRQHCPLELDKATLRAYVQDRKQFLRDGRRSELELRLESSWKPGFTFASTERCVNNSPAREISNALGISPSARDQVQHKGDTEAKEGI